MRLNRGKQTLYEGFIANLNEDSWKDAVVASYEHFTYDLGRTPSIDDIYEDLVSQGHLDDNDPDVSYKNMKDIKYVLDKENLEYLHEECDKPKEEPKKANFKEVFKRLSESYKPVQDMWEGPGTYYIGAKAVTGSSIEDSYDISDEEQFERFLKDHPEYVENNCNGYLSKFHTHGTSSYSGEYWKPKDLKESDEHHNIPDYCREGVEGDVYDDRQLDVRSAQFNGNDFVVESRQELTEEVFDKIVKRLQYHFNYWGIEYDSIEDDGNRVIAIGCYMPDAAYKEYIANADDAEDEVLTINGQTFKDVSDAKAWLDEKIIEYGNTYFFPDSERNILNKLIEKFGNTYFWK